MGITCFLKVYYEAVKNRRHSILFFRFYRTNVNSPELTFMLLKWNNLLFATEMLYSRGVQSTTCIPEVEWEVSASGKQIRQGTCSTVKDEARSRKQSSILGRVHRTGNKSKQQIGQEEIGVALKAGAGLICGMSNLLATTALQSPRQLYPSPCKLYNSHFYNCMCNACILCAIILITIKCS